MGASDISPEIVMAVILSFAGNVVNAFGYIMQKMGHSRVQRSRSSANITLMRLRYKVDERPDVCFEDAMEAAEEECRQADEHTFLTEPIWVIGFVLYMIGSLMHVASLGFGPQALLTPMEGVTLAANAVLAPIFLNEQLKPSDYWGTLVVLIGITVTVIFGPHSSITYTAEEMLRMLSEPAFLAWTLITTVFTIGVFVLVRLAEISSKSPGGVEMNGDLARKGARVIVFGNIWIAGIFSSWTMLTAKQVAELTETTLSGKANQFDGPTPYLIFGTFLLFNLLMEFFKQRALATFSALIVVPVFQVNLVVLSVIGGAIYFSEFAGMEGWRVGAFTAGLFIVCAGIVVLSMAANQEKPIRLYSAILVVVTAQKMVRKLRLRQVERDGHVTAAKQDNSRGPSTPSAHPHVPSGLSPMPIVSSPKELPPLRLPRGVGEVQASPATRAVMDEPSAAPPSIFIPAASSDANPPRSPAHQTIEMRSLPDASSKGQTPMLS